MVSALRKAVAWVIYRLIRAYWWIRRPVILGVRVLIADRDRVLLVKHSYREGWFLPGGTPEAGESLVETARREAQEETGVPIRDVTLLGIYSSLDGSESNHVAVFKGEHGDQRLHQADSPSEGAVRTPEVSEVRWVSATDPPRQAVEQTRLILRDWRRGRTPTYRLVRETQDPDACRP
jgi:8-oxo-dGTP pyrophosphatase MutT (NUDIX family)